MKTLQEIVKEMKADFVKAFEDCSLYKEDGDTPYMHGVESGRIKAFTKYIPQLELLLNEQPEAITEDAQFRKHDVRRSVASESDQVIGDSGADSSETAAVRQNEQTIEDYPHPMDEACTECDTIPDEDGRCLCWGG